MNYNDIPLIRNEEDGRFEMVVNGHFSFILYEMMKDNIINLYHTEVDPALAGKGISNVLVQRTLEYCRQNDLRVLPTCPFITGYILRHPEWQSITVPREGLEEV
jgi:predicted GNAT family acetyltransferase